jgi:hypothetical protein
VSLEILSLPKNISIIIYSTRTLIVLSAITKLSLEILSLPKNIINIYNLIKIESFKVK